MHAMTVRTDRFGEPRHALRPEVVDLPPLRHDHDVLVWVMAAGVNYNTVWACQGLPLDVVTLHAQEGEGDFHIGGSDGSGVVVARGPAVRNLKVGDQVVFHAGHWDHDCPVVKAGGDAMLSPTQRIWGYETNWGCFAQVARLRDHQCLPKPAAMDWAEAAVYLGPTAASYRMLQGYAPHAVQAGDAVLIWGGSGGTGIQAIQLARAVDARPVAVVSSPERAAYCRAYGAVGCIDRRRFHHWGPLPALDDQPAMERWLNGARAFGRAIWDALGERRNPRLVFEHPGGDTLPTSLFVCDGGGMVVLNGATTGYYGSLDLRYLWMRQKRLQGCHYANQEQIERANDLVVRGLVKPTLSRTFAFADLPVAHQLMFDNQHPPGNMAVLVGARAKG
jgi:crotonyl-CoA carboxylase/reductase